MVMPGLSPHPSCKAPVAYLVISRVAFFAVFLSCLDAACPVDSGVATVTGGCWSTVTVSRLSLRWALCSGETGVF